MSAAICANTSGGTPAWYIRPTVAASPRATPPTPRTFPNLAVLCDERPPMLCVRRVTSGARKQRAVRAWCYVALCYAWAWLSCIAYVGLFRRDWGRLRYWTRETGTVLQCDADHNNNNNNNDVGKYKVGYVCKQESRGNFIQIKPSETLGQVGFLS